MSTAPVRHLTIRGMRCSGCAGAVERALRAVAGVEAATVDLAAGHAAVTGTATAEALVAAVKRAGYDAALEEAP